MAIRLGFRHSIGSPAAVAALCAGLLMTAACALFVLHAQSKSFDQRNASEAALVTREVQTRVNRGLRVLLQAQGHFQQLGQSLDARNFDHYATSMAEALDLARPHSFGFLSLRSDQPKTGEMRFYRTFGWDETGRQTAETAWLDPEIKASLFDRARDSSAPVFAAVSGSSPVESIAPFPLLVMAMPVFKVGDGAIPPTVVGRQSRLDGFIVLIIPSHSLFGDMLHSLGLSDIDFSVERIDSSSASNARIIYSTSWKPTKVAGPSTSVWVAQTNTVEIRSRPLVVKVSRPNAFLFGEVYLMPVLLAVLGSLLSCLTFRLLRENHSQKERLVNSELQLRLVTDALPVLISYVDRHRRYRFVSRTYEEWFGLDRSQIIGRTIEDLVGSTQFARSRPYVERALRGETLSYESTLETSDGRRRPTLVHKVPDFGPRGEVRGITSLVVDISDRKEHEERNNLAADVIASLTGAHDIDEALRRFATQLAPRLCDVCRIATESEDSGLGPETVVGAAHWPDDASNSIHTSFSLGTGGRVRVSCWIDPRSHRRALGSADRSTLQELGRRAEISIENLWLLKQSERAHRVKDEFLATLSHELRTPMNVILGWLDILATEGTKDPATLEQALEAVTRNAKMQFQLINDLLDVSRIVSGKLMLHPRPIDVLELSRAALDNVRQSALAKGIELALETEGRDWNFYADPDRLQQVLWNLLSNSLKFTPPRGRVTMKLRANDECISISVYDTGQGIDPRFLPHVFERFRQEDGSSSRSQGGLGLGLSIVRYLVESHGGSVDAKSDGPGRGATFEIVFPRSAELSFSNEAAPLLDFQTRELVTLAT